MAHRDADREKEFPRLAERQSHYSAITALDPTNESPRVALNAIGAGFIIGFICEQISRDRILR
jgi:hypothetical protein